MHMRTTSPPWPRSGIFFVDQIKLCTAKFLEYVTTDLTDLTDLARVNHEHCKFDFTMFWL